jgi:hypothetical protein
MRESVLKKQEVKGNHLLCFRELNLREISLTGMMEGAPCSQEKSPQSLHTSMASVAETMRVRPGEKKPPCSRSWKAPCGRERVRSLVRSRCSNREKAIPNRRRLFSSQRQPSFAATKREGEGSKLESSSLKTERLNCKTTTPNSAENVVLGLPPKRGTGCQMGRE